MTMMVRRWINGLGLVLGLALAGCSGGGFSASPGALVSGGRDVAAEQESAERFAFVEVCPQIQVREGTGVLRRFERGKEDDPTGLVWQASVRKVARECNRGADGGSVFKVGVSGRLIAGPVGFTGSTNLPIRVVLVKNGTEVIYSQLHPVTATIAAGQGSVGWTQVVDGISIPPQSEGSFLIYIGFDELAES